MTFKKYADLYLQLNENDWKPSYFDKNRRIVKNRLDYFMSLEIRDIKASSIKLWYKTLDDVGNKSKRNYLSVLKGILDVALHDEIIEKNPMVHVKLPQYRSPRINPFTADEVKRILEGAKAYNFNFEYFLAMGFFTGMRTGEILALKRQDIDFKNNMIHIRSTISRFGDVKPKTFGSIRDIPIIDTLYPYILQMFEKENDNYLMTTQYGNAYQDTHIFCIYWWKPLLESLGIPYRRPYNMRHTFATNMLYKELCTPVELSQYLGHSNTRMIYDVYVSYIQGHFNTFKTDILIYS
ncbi:MAG: tyrosine-type recombinase/integrase [Sulfurospirillaceae bacterium]|nr:tyrosine-type recombinase/integrase [Sulfurospirillaceae bacterium]MDD3462461.1 tyrosine-type recombinase/integrase [Sulfurospirillaceae bacterium]